MGRKNKHWKRKAVTVNPHVIANELPRNRYNGDPDWSGKCEVCGASPVVSGIGLCGPCCFGEADTVGGNW